MRRKKLEGSRYEIAHESLISVLLIISLINISFFSLGTRIHHPGHSASFFCWSQALHRKQFRDGHHEASAGHTAASLLHLTSARIPSSYKRHSSHVQAMSFFKTKGEIIGGVNCGVGWGVGVHRGSKLSITPHPPIPSFIFLKKYLMV